MTSPWLTTASPDPTVGDEPTRLLDEPPSGSGYRAATSDERCGGCLHFKDGVCHLWEARVAASMTCDDWAEDVIGDADEGDVFDLPEGMDGTETSPWILGGAAGFSDDLPATPIEVFCDDSRTAQGDGLVWKELLRTGTWATTPGPGAQPVNKPLTVKLRADNPFAEVGLQDLKDAFDAGAMDHVTIPLSHSNKVDENTGFVRKLRIIPDPKRPGHHSMWAGYEFKDPDVERKVKLGAIANNSAGIVFRSVKKRTGEVFPQVLEHAALTNKPWLDGLTPFGGEVPTQVTQFSLSEEIDAADKVDIDRVLQFGSSAPLAKTAKKDNWVDFVGGLPRYVREVARSLHRKRGMPLSRAIATAISRIKVWAVKSTNPKTKAKAAKAVAEWEAKKMKSKLRKAKKGRSGKNLSEITDNEFVMLGLSEALVDDAPDEMVPTPVRRMSLSEARRHRKMLFRKEATLSRTTAQTSSGRESREEVKIDDIVRENEELRRKVREGEVDTYITALSETWGDHPALLKEVKDIMLADDGGPVLQLSEGGEGEDEGEPGVITLSASDIVERLLDKVPAPTSKTRLSEQTRRQDNHSRPADKEDTPTPQERALAFAEAVGDREYLRAIKASETGKGE